MLFGSATPLKPGMTLRHEYSPGRWKPMTKPSCGPSSAPQGVRGRPRGVTVWGHFNPRGFVAGPRGVTVGGPPGVTVGTPPRASHVLPMAIFWEAWFGEIGINRLICWRPREDSNLRPSA
jgi:hypothetical protein